MRGSRRSAVGATTMALVVGCTGFGSTVPAFADTEPNNVISQAEGPVGGGVAVVGSLSTPDDVDYYVFYAASQQQLHLTADDLTNPDDDGDCMDAGFVDTNGASVPNDYTTPPGVNRYFLRLDVDSGFSCSNPQTYRFRIDPAGGVTGGPPLDRALSPTGEPNETPAQAAGPLQAAVNYVGTHDTINDEDWFFFWVPPGPHQLDLSVTSPTPATYGCEAEVALYGGPASESYVATAEAGSSSFGHVNQTLVGPDDYFIRAGIDDEDCLTGRWQFRIETPDAVTLVNPFAPPPAPPQPAPVAAVPARPRYATSVSLRRRGARYSGRVSSTRLGCKVSRRVVLRRFGSGTKSFGSTRTRSNGTFSIQRSRRLRGRVFASVTDRYTTAAVCRGGRSRSIRG